MLIVFYQKTQEKNTMILGKLKTEVLGLKILKHKVRKHKKFMRTLKDLIHLEIENLEMQTFITKKRFIEAQMARKRELLLFEIIIRLIKIFKTRILKITNHFEAIRNS